MTISKALIAEAKALGINASSAAEAGIATAVKAAKESTWLKESQKAIGAYNERIDATPPVLAPGRPRR